MATEGAVSRAAADALNAVAAVGPVATVTARAAPAVGVAAWTGPRGSSTSGARLTPG